MVAVLALTCLVLAALHGPAFAASKYLNPATGSDSAAGTSSATAWKTLNKAISKTCGAGTTACLLPGDELLVKPGTYNRTQYQTNTSIIDWDQNKSLGAPNNPITIRCETPTGCIFDGLWRSYWLKFTASTTSYPGHYVIVRDLTFFRYDYTAVGIVSSGPTQMAHHIAQIHTGHYNFGQAQHAATITNYGHHILLRDNKYYNTNNPNKAIPGGLGQEMHALYISKDTDDIVVEGTYAETIAGACWHAFGGNIQGQVLRQQIWRRNVCVNAHKSHLILTGGEYDRFYYYNNTGYNDLIPYPLTDNLSGYAGWDSHLSYQIMRNTRMINNISDGFFVRDGGAAVVVRAPAASFPGLLFDYNLFRNQANASRTYAWDGVYYTLAGFKAATAFQDNGKDTNPGFVNVAARNFTLAAGSSAIDAGRVLTTAVGAGTNSTSLIVADAGYFFDGYDLVPGDTVCINNANPVEITGVDYTTNTLTLAATRTWTNGQSVSPCYSGAAPDMGAFETPVQALAFTTQPVGVVIGTPMAPVVVTARDGQGNIATGFTGSVTLDKSSGPGTLTCTALSVNAVAGLATFSNCTVDVVGTYALRAITPGYANALSAQFSSLATAPPTVLAAPRQPLVLRRGK